MNIELEKKQIISEILTLEDEWIIKAIKKLLDLDVDITTEFSEEHKNLIEERLQEYNATPQKGISLEDLKRELKSQGKL